jgi:hypothetical protein
MPSIRDLIDAFRNTINPLAESQADTIDWLREYYERCCSYADKYFTLEAVDSGVITWYSEDYPIYYSTDDGRNWTLIPSGEETDLNVEAGDIIQFKGYIVDPEDFGKFYGTASFEAYGNIMSLLYGDDFQGQDELRSEYVFREMFVESNITEAENLILPATALTRGCYQGMFMSGYTLSSVPVLPATVLAEDCYREMFERTAITKMPELPATELEPGCYEQMFSMCNSLVDVVPILPATVLAESCYQGMFSECISMTEAPELPATELAPNCYQSMFATCRSITAMPQLPATQLAPHCYEHMFGNCYSLTEVLDELPATELAEHCYEYMFQSCIDMTRAPELPATTLVPCCYERMFTSCSSLNYIKAMFLTEPSTEFTESWVFNVAPSGTFVKNSQATWTNVGEDAVPQGWTVNNE